MAMKRRVFRSMPGRVQTSPQGLGRDLLLDFGVEVVAVRKRTVDPGITQHLAPNRQAVFVDVPRHRDLLLQV
jgi:hypothetical protein